MAAVAGCGQPVGDVGEGEGCGTGVALFLADCFIEPGVEAQCADGTPHDDLQLDPVLNRCWTGACRSREAGRHAVPASHVLAEELLDKARPVTEKFSDPCRVPQLKGQVGVRGAGIFELPDQLGPVRGRGDSDDQTFRAEGPGPVSESGDGAGEVRFAELTDVLALVSVGMMPEPGEADDVDAVLLLARCAVPADLDETVDVYRQRDQQFLEVLPVLQRERQFGDLAVRHGWLDGERRE